MRLASALAISSSLHLAVLLPVPWQRTQAPRPAAMPPLQARLVEPPPPPPKLIAPEPPVAVHEKPPEPRSEKPRPRTDTPPRNAIVEPRIADPVTLAKQQVAQHLLYPPEAVSRGIEGETLVMLFLDAEGNAMTARVERGSGHAILDDAAVRAARQVRALPDGAAREIVLPVRFRLR